MTAAIQFGSKEIEFEISYSKRKSLGITVSPDLRVYVKAPEATRLERIRETVKKKAPWILKQQDYFLSFHPKTPPRKFVSGETHLYLGRQYRLKIQLGKKNSVLLKGRYIEVQTKGRAITSELVKEWYRNKAKDRFVDIAKPFIQRFKKYKVEPSGLYIQDMKQRWGSCTPNGKIILNTELIKAPKACIEYVIIHELCHLVHHDHTAKFFALQTKEMPDWEKWKMRLERLLA